MFKTFEKAIQAKKTLVHTGTLDATPEAIWKAVKVENSILPKALPHIFESCTFVHGNGEVGSVRVCKMGPGRDLAVEIAVSIAVSFASLCRLFQVEDGLSS